MKIITIEAPSLDSAQYGQGIVTAVENINKNFNMLNNPAFEKGDDAAPVKSAVVDLEAGTISGINSKLRQKILDDINSLLIANGFNKGCKYSKFNMYYNDLNIPEMPTENDKFEEFFKEFIKIYLLSFSPLYVYDEEYYSQNIYHTGITNKTGAYVIQYNEEFTLEKLSGYPKLNFIDNKWVWEIGDLDIDAQGPSGKNGRDGSTYFVSVDKNNTIETINGQTPQDNAQYVDQVAFTLSDELKTLLIGYIKLSDEGKLEFNAIGSVTSEFTDKNFLECLLHIGSGNASPGLFVPITKSTDGTGAPQSPDVHMIYDSGNGANLQITPGKLALNNGKPSWKPLETTGNLTIDYNTNISGNLTAKSAAIGGNTTIKSGGANADGTIDYSITTSSAQIGTNTTIDSTGIKTKSTTIGENTIINSDGIVTNYVDSEEVVTNSATIGTNTTINSTGIKTNSANISGNLAAGTVNDLKIEKDSGTANVSVKTDSNSVGILRYGKNGTLNNFYWRVKWYKKNGWVKVIIYAASDEKGTMITTSNWRFFTTDLASNKSVNMTDYWNSPVNNTPFSGLPKPMDESATFTFMDYIGGLVTNNTVQDNKFSWMLWGLKYESGGFNLIPMRGNIHNLNTDRDGANNITDGNSKYYPYFEFTYPTND